MKRAISPSGSISTVSSASSDSTSTTTARDDEPLEVLAPYLAEGSVELHSWPTPFRLKAARLAYADCLERVRGQARWLACLDIDEFLFAPQGWTLIPSLRRFEEFPGVVVRWQVYGSNGLAHASREPVIARFPRRAPTDWVRNRRVKSIVDPQRAEAPANCHHFVYRGGELRRRREPRARRLDSAAALQEGAAAALPPARTGGALLRSVRESGDITSSKVSVGQLHINHYPIKSREEFVRKARMMEGSRRYDSVDYFTYHDRNDVLDPILSRYVPHLGQRSSVTAMAEARS